MEGKNLLSRLGNVLRGEQDRALGRRAVRAGHLTEEELEAFLSGPERGSRKLEELLREKGVSEDAVVALRGELDREDFSLFRPDRTTPPEVLGVPDDPKRRLAEFVLVTRLGQGGIGEVWKAWDTRLGRWVAVKLPRTAPEPEDASRRFTREALAAARLSHPNIVGIYRVAEEPGRPFIVMQYVEGTPLSGVRPDVSQALDFMRTVARAVHHAHEQGVIHRDIKPGNILIRTDGRPFVLDFGLAHLEEAKWLQSREGQIVGTAAYMSPEQAQGGPAARGRSTDVYSLGATLHEALTGRPPFQGDSFAEILEKVLHRDPESVRSLNPAVPREVEAVVHKAMEKDARNRYANAGELADDLDRCARGELPMAVRHGSFSATMRRQVRQHPRVTVGIVAGVALLALVVGWFESQRWIREQQEQEEKLRAIRDLSGLSYQAIMELRRAGATDGMKEILPRLESAYDEALAAAPEHGEIEYLMGRIQRTLMNDARAEELQDRALEKDPDYEPALYEKIVLSARRFGRETKPGPVFAEARRVRTLDASRGLLAEGICRVAGGDRETGRRRLEEVLAKDPELSEAREALALTWLESVTPYSAPAAQESAFDRAEEVLSAGIERDQGYAPLWIGRAEVRASRGRLFRETGREPRQEFQGADDDLTQAIRLRESADAYRRRARLRRLVGVHRMVMGGNPTEDFKEADQDLSLATLIDQGDPRTLEVHCQVRRSRAEYLARRGESPEEEAEGIEEGARLILERDPQNRKVHIHRGIVWAYNAIHALRSGDHPDADFERALEAFKRAGFADPELLERRAYVLVERATWIEKSGGDPAAALSTAEADIEKAISSTEFFNRACITRASVRRLQGRGAAKRGSDPMPVYDRAFADLEKVLSVNPLSTDAWIERGRLEFDRGSYRMEKADKQGARERFTQSIRCFEEALKLNPFLPGRLRRPLREAQRALINTY